MGKKWMTIFLIGIVMITGLIGCGKAKEEQVDGNKKTITYGKAAGPYTILFEDAVMPILEKEGYEFECVEFSDLLQSDMALNEGEIDMNVEQHTAYMKNFNKEQNGNLLAITPIPTVPAGLFSSTHKTLEEITENAKIAVPNDASNTSRAYAILQKAGWIKLDSNVDISAVTQDDIIENPYNLQFTEMDSANIPRSLDEFDYAVIPGSVVYSAGMDADSVLLQEDVAEHLLLQVVINEKEKDSDWAKAVVNAYRSEEFKKYMEENNHGLWYVPNSQTK